MDREDTFAAVRVCDDAESVARAVAEAFVEKGRAAINRSGRFSVVLAGGSTPKRVYEMLAGDDFRPTLDWRKVHFFFGDERCVPPDHLDSNYRMANEALLRYLDVSPQQVHRMEGEREPHESARRYEDDLRALFGDTTWPEFDLILLGMGDDGHTASLFPGTRALDEQTAWVAANQVEKFNTFRLTLTLPVINHAGDIIFIVTGAAKAETLARVFGAVDDKVALPAQLIRPTAGTLTWFVDRAAAALLPSKPVPEASTK